LGSRASVYTIYVRFTWDPAEAASNLAKHGVSFDVVESLAMENAFVRATLGHATGEPRLVALAPIGDRLHALVYSVERQSVHVISLRKANDGEMTRYESEV
jgi:uncharacterized DUF497 family protein